MRLLGWFPEAARLPLGCMCGALILALSSCGSPANDVVESSAKRAAPSPSHEIKPKTPPAEPRLAPELRSAGPGPVSELIAGELAAARTDRRRLIVYVGAPWCEPCVAFHDALLAGELGDALPGIRFLEFNMDDDHDRLAEAGYTSRLIPLFVVPASDGKAGPRRIEGGIKGPASVPNLVGRLRPLIAD